jgi:hypothetical protein
MPQDGVQLVHRFRDVFNGSEKVEVLDEILTDDYVYHDGNQDEKLYREDLKKYVETKYVETDVKPAQAEVPRAQSRVEVEFAVGDNRVVAVVVFPDMQETYYRALTVHRIETDRIARTCFLSEPTPSKLNWRWLRWW